MPNVNSNDKFGRSMDASQLIELRRKYVNTNLMYQVNEENDPNIKPRFAQDKFNRESHTSGVSEYYFQRGLSSVYSRFGSTK